MSKQHLSRPEHTRTVVSLSVQQDDEVSISTMCPNRPRAEYRAIGRSDFYVSEYRIVFLRKRSSSLSVLRHQCQMRQMEGALDGDYPDRRTGQKPRHRGCHRKHQNGPQTLHTCFYVHRACYVPCL